MKTIKFLTYTVFVLLLSTVITSCSPEDGEQGPAGADGIDGTDGNANVQTGTVDLVSGDWLWHSEYGFDGTSRFTRYVDLNVPEINADIDQNGLVLLYFKSTPNSGWQPLPFEYSSFGANNSFTHIVYETSIENIRLHYFNIGFGSSLATYNIENLSFKYVLIKGNPIAKNSENKGIDLKKMSYEEVMDYHNLDY